MVKVLKTSSLELEADFEEIFDGATIEEATQKAHNQKMPSEFAKVNITNNKLNRRIILLHVIMFSFISRIHCYFIIFI